MKKTKIAINRQSQEKIRQFDYELIWETKVGVESYKDLYVNPFSVKPQEYSGGSTHHMPVLQRPFCSLMRTTQLNKTLVSDDILILARLRT